MNRGQSRTVDIALARKAACATLTEVLLYLGKHGQLYSADSLFEAGSRAHRGVSVCGVWCLGYSRLTILGLAERAALTRNGEASREQMGLCWSPQSDLAVLAPYDLPPLLHQRRGSAQANIRHRCRGR